MTLFKLDGQIITQQHICVCARRIVGKVDACESYDEDNCDDGEVVDEEHLSFTTGP